MATMKVPYRVIFGDTDALGVVYHANYLRFIDMARAEWYREFSLSPMVLYKEMEYAIVIIQMHMDLKRPARFDDLLKIELWANAKWVKNASIRFDFKIYNEDGEICVRGYTRHAYTGLNGSLKRPSRDFIASMHKLAEDRSYED